jgi:hypothetical protein
MTFQERLGNESRHKIWLLYLRKSRQDDPNETVEEVLEKHEIQLQEWAERELGCRIPEENIYREIVSGESIEARQEIKKVLARIEDPNVAGVIVMEPSRLSRGDLSDCARIIDSFRFSRSLVATPYMTYDLENKMERKFFKDELLRSSDFLDYTKELLWRGRVAAHKRGCYLGNYAPYGYRKIKIGKDHTLEIIEDQAEVVRLVFDLYIKEDKAPYQIACRLNEMGVKPARCNSWSKDTVRVMLRNPHYAGYVAFNRIKKTPVLENGEVIIKRLAQPEEEQIIAEGKHTGIISRDVWAAAQELVARHPRVNYEKEIKNPYAGIMFCGKCGRAMAWHPYKHAEDRFNCKKRPPCFKSVRVSVIHEAVLAALEEAELPALELKVQNGDGDARKIQQRLLVKLEKQMEDYRAQEERQYDLLETNPNYSQEVFNRRNKALRDKMDECQAAIYKAKSALPQSVDYAERVVALKNAIAILKDADATPAEQNRIIKAIVERIEYSSVPSDQENKKRLRDGAYSPFNLRISLRL